MSEIGRTSGAGGPRPERLDAAAAACAFLAHLLLREDAGPHVAASLTAKDADAWPLARDADTAAGVRLLHGVVADRPAADVLKADFRRLFVGPGPVAANPFESVHRSADGLTFDEQTTQVRQAYAAFGLAAPAPGREPDDHIGLELAFVGELLVAAIDALEASDLGAASAVLDGAERFTREHLLEWAPGFADLVIARADTDLYRAAGHLLRGALPQIHAAAGSA